MKRRLKELDYEHQEYVANMKRFKKAAGKMQKRKKYPSDLIAHPGVMLAQQELPVKVLDNLEKHARKVVK